MIRCADLLPLSSDWFTMHANSLLAHMKICVFEHILYLNEECTTVVLVHVDWNISLRPSSIICVLCVCVYFSQRVSFSRISRCGINHCLPHLYTRESAHKTQGNRGPSRLAASGRASERTKDILFGRRANAYAVRFPSGAHWRPFRRRMYGTARHGSSRLVASPRSPPIAVHYTLQTQLWPAIVRVPATKAEPSRLQLSASVQVYVGWCVLDGTNTQDIAFERRHTQIIHNRTLLVVQCRSVDYNALDRQWRVSLFACVFFVWCVCLSSLRPHNRIMSNRSVGQPDRAHRTLLFVFGAARRCVVDYARLRSEPNRLQAVNCAHFRATELRLQRRRLAAAEAATVVIRRPISESVCETARARTYVLQKTPSWHMEAHTAAIIDMCTQYWATIINGWIAVNQQYRKRQANNAPDDVQYMPVGVFLDGKPHCRDDCANDCKIRTCF